MILYHYTSVVHLPWIVDAGYLGLTDNVLHHDRIEEPGVCWFLDRPLVEIPYSHGLAGSIVDKTAVQFTVDVPDGWVRRWVPWAQDRGVEPLWLTAMVRAGGGFAAADHWHVTFRTVPRNRWVSVLLAEGVEPPAGVAVDRAS